MTLQIDDPIVYALNRMGFGGFRHIPLVDDEGYPVGSVSVQFLLRYVVEFFGEEVLTIPPKSALKGPKSREGA